MPTKQELAEARKWLSDHRTKIDDFSCDIPEAVTYIDWGISRGQGKRTNGIIKGSMSGAPRGVKKYVGIDISKYLTDLKDYVKFLELYQKARYYKAREYGADHIQAMLFALCKF